MRKDYKAPPLVEVVLIGFMAERFGASHFVRGHSADELLEGICVNQSGFKTYLYNSEVEYRMFAGDTPLDFSDCPVGADRLILLPVPAGSGSVGRTILGVGFLVAAATTGGNPLLVRLGAAFLISGISGLLSSRQRTPDKSEREGSFLFDDLPDSGNDDQAIPIVYGQGLVEGVVLSQSGSTTDYR